MSSCKKRQLCTFVATKMILSLQSCCGPVFATAKVKWSLQKKKKIISPDIIPTGWPGSQHHLTAKSAQDLQLQTGILQQQTCPLQLQTLQLQVLNGGATAIDTDGWISEFDGYCTGRKQVVDRTAVASSRRSVEAIAHRLISAIPTLKELYRLL